MAVLLGLFVAASFGTGDFLGGLAARRAAVLVVLSIAQISALVLALAVTLGVGGAVHGDDMMFGLAAGVLNIAALGCLYRGLAIGRMGQVAPVAAVVGAIVPVAWGAIRGESLAWPVWLGIAAAIVAGGMLSGGGERRSSVLLPGVLLAVAAGIGFGVSFVLFASASHHGGLWPALSARAGAALVVWAVTAIVRPAAELTTPTVGLAFGAGVLDVGATMILVLTLKTNLTAVIAPVAALAPAFTALHARWYLHEHNTRSQLAGMALALLGLMLIATA